jgi:pSer/pThr/pTyr-binding forkhead associated (FHA) protein
MPAIREAHVKHADAEIFLNSAGVSRRHARITISAGRATIEDLGSKNGTFVGNQRVDSPRSIVDGDTIGVGAVKLTLTVVQSPSSTGLSGVKGTPDDTRSSSPAADCLIGRCP